MRQWQRGRLRLLEPEESFVFISISTLILPFLDWLSIQHLEVLPLYIIMIDVKTSLAP